MSVIISLARIPIEAMSWILGACVMKIKRLDRRQFLWQGFATLSTTLLLKACTRNSNPTKEPTDSGLDGKSDLTFHVMWKSLRKT
ncbi:MAG TPA: hypothetical protein V6C85_15815 [Allocoleopsis sp.]